MKHSIPLYHGTDARLFELTKEERIKYFSCIEKALNYLWEIFEPYYTKRIEKKLYMSDGSFEGTISICVFESYKQMFVDAGQEDLYLSSMNALIILGGIKRNSPLYQYDFIGASNSRERAAGYACRAYVGGERGLCAYTLIKANEFLSLPEFNPNSEIFDAIERIKDFGKEGKEKPAIIVIKDIYLEDCTLEDGRAISSSDAEFLSLCGDSQFSIRLPKGIDLSKYKIEPLK
jgi:hypothetical protein